MVEQDKAIEHTRRWIEKVVIGCNFCPFAAVPYFRGQIHFHVVPAATKKLALEAMAHVCKQLEEEKQLETALIIFPDAFTEFSQYLELVSIADELLKKEGQEGIYQVASFHPQYRFADSYEGDAANYTNRSPYPMLHILRESSVTEAVKRYPNADQIPNRNVEFARKKGTDVMKNLREDCFSAENPENQAEESE